MTRPHDPCTGRRQHPTRQAALDNPVNGPKVYHCPVCGAWHGTWRDRAGLASGVLPVRQPVTPKVQAKHLDDALLLRFIHHKSMAPKSRTVTHHRLPRWVFVWDFDDSAWERRYPWKVIHAKLGQLIKRGLLDGCNCGCRGDYELTAKGRRFIGV